MKMVVVALAALAAVRWLTYDLQPVPEVAALRVWRSAPQGSRCGERLTYFPTLLDPADADRLLVQGEVYCVDPRYGDGSALSVTLRGEEGLTSLGSDVRAPVILRVRWTQPPPPEQVIVLLRDGQIVQSGSPTELEARLEIAGSYHVELVRSVPTWYFGHRRVTWIETYPFTVLPRVAWRSGRTEEAVPL